MTIVREFVPIVREISPIVREISPLSVNSRAQDIVGHPAVMPLLGFAFYEPFSHTAGKQSCHRTKREVLELPESEPHWGVLAENIRSLRPYQGASW